MINNKLDFIDNFKFIINKCIKKKKKEGLVFPHY